MKLDIRVLQIDLARQKETKEFVKKYIDMGKKYNYTHILFYLENAVRTPSTEFFRKEETYSMEEMKELVDYAISQGLGVIPAFENLGHQEKLFDYKELERFKEAQDGIISRPFGFKDACTSNEEFLAYSDNYITEVASIFPGEFIHVGLDEPFNFAICPRCQERIKNGETKNTLFLKHILHTHALCKKLGKRMMMWDDFFENANVAESLPRDIVMTNWNYSFISQMPKGHWTNCNKKDWFSYYDKLGFDYMFCVYANRTSSVFNLESFNKYAMNHKPIGAIMTAWERADTFYEGAFAHIAYAGELWAGNINTQEDVIKLYTDVLGSRKIAEILYDYTPNADFSNFGITEKSEVDTKIKYVTRKIGRYIIKEFEEAMQDIKDDRIYIVNDIYNVLLLGQLVAEVNEISTLVYDNYELQKDVSCFIPRVKEIKEKVLEIKARAEELWARNRPGIKSTNNKFENKYKNVLTALDSALENLAKDEKYGVVTVEYMFPEMYATAQAIVTVKHKGREEEVIYKGNLKFSGCSYDLGGIYAYRFKTRNEEIEYVKFTATGEGAMYPSYVRYTYNNEYFIPAKVTDIEGLCKDTFKILEDNTRFAMLGNDDGIEHFNKVELSIDRHSVKVEFKPLV